MGTEFQGQFVAPRGSKRQAEELASWEPPWFGFSLTVEVGGLGPVGKPYDWHNESLVSNRVRFSCPAAARKLEFRIEKDANSVM